jgi:hypothetical protein
VGRPRRRKKWTMLEGTVGFSIYSNKFQLARNILINGI